MQTNHPSQQTTNNRRVNRVPLVPMQQQQPGIINHGVAANNNNRQGPLKKRKQDKVVVNEQHDDDDSIAIASAARRADAKEMIQSIVKERLFSNEPHVVSVAMESLVGHLRSCDGNISDNIYNCTVAFNCGAPLAIVKAMDWNKDSGYAGIVRLCGINALSYIACSEIQGSQLRQSQGIVASGGLQACLQALDENPCSPDMQRAGLCLIGNLWWYPNNRKTAVDQGGLTAVMNAMKKHKQNTKVQYHVCYALRTFVSLDESPTWAKAAVDAGTIEAVIEAMGNHSDHVELQKEGCMFLTIVARSNDDYRNMILDAKGLVPIVEALRIHKHNKQIAAEAWKALNAITSNT